MRIVATCILLIPTLLITSLFVGIVSAQEVSFKRVQLDYNICLDIPSNWKVLSQIERQNITVRGKEQLKKAEIEGPSGKVKLLAVNAIPDPTGAMISVSVCSPPEYTQDELAAATPADLKEFGLEFHNAFKKLEKSGGPKITEMQPVRIEMLNKYRVLVVPYVRVGVNEPVTWQVTQYRIPVSDRLIEIILSHRQSDANVWQPILERVKSSLQF